MEIKDGQGIRRLGFLELFLTLGDIEMTSIELDNI